MPIRLRDADISKLLGGRPVAWQYQASRGIDFRVAAIAQDDFEALEREMGMPWLSEYLDVTKRALDDWAAGLSDGAAMDRIAQFSDPPDKVH